MCVRRRDRRCVMRQQRESARFKVHEIPVLSLKSSLGGRLLGVVLR